VGLGGWYCLDSMRYDHGNDAEGQRTDCRCKRGPGEYGRRRGNRARLRRDFGALRYHLFLPFRFLGRRSIDPHSRRHEIFNNTDHRQRVVRMRHDACVTAKEGVDQCALARVQKWDGELAKITERPEQIKALPERKFNAHQPMLCFKQQEAGLEPI